MKIGNISYHTLEEGVEKEWNAINVFVNPFTTCGLSFSKSREIDLRIADDINGLASIVSFAANRVYCNFHPLFKKKQFDKIVREIVCERTHFERADLFDSGKHGTKLYVGMFYCTPRNDQNGKPLKAGSYIKVGENENPKLNLLHEYGHEMHWRLCSRDPDKYNEYDGYMHEIMAVHFERTFLKKSYNYNLHKTANKLLDRFLDLNEIKAMDFHEQWKFLLQFKKHKLLEHYINFSEENNPKIAILERNGFSWRIK